MPISARPATARTSTGLSKALWLDAVTACGFGTACVTASAYLAGLTGLSATFILSAGAISLAAAALIAVAASRMPPSGALLRTIIAGNAIWVLASLLVVATSALSHIGMALVVGQAVFVAILTGLEHSLSGS